MKQFILIIGLVVLVSTGISAQKNKLQEVKIKTSAVCDMCKERIENGLYTQKGIVEAKLDVASKVVTIKYRSNKTTENDMRKYISSLGYNADSMMADKIAYEKLPGCCQLNGMH